MSLAEFQKQLENELNKSVQFKINDNRSTMLSVKWDPDCTKVSLHRFFLDAPRNVMDSLACYIKQEESDVSLSVKSFIEENIRTLDYSHHLRRLKLETRGTVYHLGEMYQDVNREYFNNGVHLNITWFGKKHQKNRSQVTFGLYHEPLKLIKVNRLLDNAKFPPYLISYVIFHEMLHYVCPSYYNENGKLNIHNREFKEKETQFKQFDQVQDWIKENREWLFANG